jgi:hypothetical protein
MPPPARLTIDEFRALAERAPIEDVVDVFLEQRAGLAAESPDAVGELEAFLWERVWNHAPWRDLPKAARALRWCRDTAPHYGPNDGDTETRLLVELLAVEPGDDALLAEYVYSVASNDYRYAGRHLGDVAKGLADREQAKTLALVDTIAEYFVLSTYLEPPQNAYVRTLQRAFATAVALGATAADWQATRQWVLGVASFARVPDDLFATYASAP